jgi:hypothetical protein
LVRISESEVKGRFGWNWDRFWFDGNLLTSALR